MPEQCCVGALLRHLLLVALSSLSRSVFYRFSKGERYSLFKRGRAEWLLRAVHALPLVIDRDANKRATGFPWEVAVIGKRRPIRAFGVFAVVEI